ncbi:hypothetical protein M3Y96_00013400 [Aphelenchoides besseyi]|nr:hypothetical protein M3Y96_00013400 [Aphelenchoides besseyi]
MWILRFLLLMGCALVMSAAVIGNQRCNVPIQVMTLVDLTINNVTEFRQVQSRLIEILHHIDNVSRGRILNFGLIAFHRNAVPLTGLSTPSSTKSDQVIGQIASLNPRGAQVSRARALNEAAKQIRLSGIDGASTIVLLADSGRVSNDLVGDVVSAIDQLTTLNATLFAVTSETSNIKTPDGYTAMYKNLDDLPEFLSSVDASINACLEDLQPNGIPTHGPRAFGIRSVSPSVALSSECKEVTEIELAILLDTSGSLRTTYDRERQLAYDLVKNIEPESLVGRKVNVEVLEFNEEPHVVVPRREKASKSELLKKIANIQFTGRQTRITDAVELALREWGSQPKAEVVRILVLISDGHGQDYWDLVRKVANELQEAKVNVFVGSTSSDLNFSELRLYANGQMNRIFIGSRDKQLPKVVSSFIANCLSTDPKASTQLPPNEPFLPISTHTSINQPHIDKIKMPSVATHLNEVEGSGVEENESTSTSFSTETSTTTSIVDSTVEDELLDFTTSNSEVFETPKELRRSPGDQFAKRNKSAECKVDVVFVVDTSQSVESDFRNQLMVTVDLVKRFPSEKFEKEVRVGAITFYSNATIELPLEVRSKNEVLDRLLNLKHNGGSTSAATGVAKALELINENRRSDAEMVVLLVSDGNSQDQWSTLVDVSSRLHRMNVEVRAVTVSKVHFFRELEVYAGNSKHVYTENQIREFLEDTTDLVVECRKEDDSHATTSIEEINSSTREATTSFTDFSVNQSTKPVRNFAISANKDGIEFAARDEAVESNLLFNNQSCETTKLDLILLLDASTSRENVFEHQRELALSLIERLPISADDTHVSLGYSTFTNIAILRQTLGLGRDREMVRKALEEIPYNGGSTLTSKALQLAVDELDKGRRSDAIAAIVLMNDGMDPWEEVLTISKRLEESRAERFGVALGDDVDLRELKLYIGNDSRIYRDGSTERFLQDVTSLLRGNSNCPLPTIVPEVMKVTKRLRDEENCAERPLDVVVLFDSTDDVENNSTEPRLSANRYMILDVLGSLPLGHRKNNVRVAVFSFGDVPRLHFGFERDQSRDQLFAAVESIEPTKENPSYARAVQVDNIICEAVHSGKQANLKTITELTGSADRFFGYDRNAEFARNLQKLAGDANGKCSSVNNATTLESTTSPSTASPVPENKTTKTEVESLSTSEADSFAIARSRDITSAKDSDKIFNDDKQTKIVQKSEEKPTATKSITKSTLLPTVTSEATTGKVSLNKTTLSTSTREPLKTARTLMTTKNTTKAATSRPTILTSLQTSTTTKTANRPSISTSTLKSILSGSSSRCQFDVALILDVSGSVVETFTRERQIASDLLKRLPVSPDTVRVAVIKFASAGKVRTVHSFKSNQTIDLIGEKMNQMFLTKGTTAIHSALLQAAHEFTTEQGARPGKAKPIAVIFSDGFGEQDSTEAAKALKQLGVEIYAIGYPIAREELERITGEPNRVYTDSNVVDFYDTLVRRLRC